MAPEEEGTLAVPKVAVWTVYLTVFLDMLGTYISNPVIPFYAATFGTSSTMVGYLFSAPACAAVVTGRLLGKAADHYGRRPVLIVSLLGASVGSIMQVCTTSFAALLCARFFFGIWLNSMATATVYIADVATGLVRSEGMAQLTSIKQLAMFFGPGVGGMLSIYGLSIPILADGMATLIAAFFAYAFLVETPAWQNLQTIREVQPKGSMQSPVSKKFKILMIPTFLNAAVLVNMNMTLALFAKKKHGFNAFHVGLMYLSSCVITVFTTCCLQTRIQRAIGLFQLAVIACAGQGICLMLMAFMGQDWGFVSFYLISRIFGSAKLASAQTVLSNSTEASDRGRLMGIKNQIENFANIVTPPIMGMLLESDLTLPWIFCAIAQVIGATCTWAVRPTPEEDDGYRVLAREPESVRVLARNDGYIASKWSEHEATLKTPSTCASTPSTMSLESGFQQNITVALMKYQFGSYDYKGIDEKWQIPQIEGFDIAGFFFASKGVLTDHDVAKMKEYGWKAIILDLEAGTPYVAAERVTTKKVKFGVPVELRTFDIVITHDCDVEANYTLAIPYMVGLLEEHRNAALFQQHERRLSTLEEIDLFLKDKPHRILTSREKVMEWRAEVEELAKSNRYDLSGSAYIKCNCFAFRPNDSSFLKAGERIFEKCLVIQRDQFIVPWAVQEECVDYSLVTQGDLEAHGFVFPALLRDARTGVFN